MKSIVRRRFSIVALVAAIAAASLSLASCGSEPPPPPGNSAAPANTSPTPATNAPVATNGATAPTTPGPLGMENSIEGRVVGLICYRQNPNASVEEAKACATANAERGGALGILGNDGILYVDEHPDARVTNGKLKFFIGEEVTVQGQMIGDAPELGWDNVKVKKFKFVLARRKGAAAPGTPKQMEATNTSKAPAAPAAPPKKP